MAILPKIASGVGRFLGNKVKQSLAPPPVQPTAPVQGPAPMSVQPQAPSLNQLEALSAVTKDAPPAISPQMAQAPVPSVPAPVAPRQTSTASPIFRGENNQLFFRGGDGFKKISNEQELQRLAKAGTIEVGGERRQLPSDAFSTPTQGVPKIPAGTDLKGDRATFQAEQARQAELNRVDPLTAQRDALRQQLVGSQLPTSEEAKIQDRITTLLSQGNIAQAQALENAANLSGQGRGITLDIVTGQQGALTRAGALAKQTAAQEALPLEQRLANLISQRGQGQTAALTQLGFANKDIEAQRLESAEDSQKLEQLALQAAKSGASEEEISGILSSGSFADALGLTSPFLQAGGEAPIKLGQGDILVNPVTGETVAGNAKTLDPLEFEKRSLEIQKLQNELSSPGGGKTPSSGQFQAAGFAERMEDATAIIDELDDVVNKNFNLGKFAPNSLKSEDRRRFEQAERNFINAVLRQESGAAIAESEFISARKQYIPQFGETEKELQQKRENRNVVFRNMKAEAGNAFGASGDALDSVLDGIGFNSDLSTSQNGSRNIVKLRIGNNSNVRVNDDFAKRLQKANDAMKRATGQEIKINQSFRSSEEQAELFRKSQAGLIGRAAPPGSSFHEKGLAIDVSNWKQAQPFLAKYGIINGLPGDMGHFSLGELS